MNDRVEIVVEMERGQTIHVENMGIENVLSVRVLSAREWPETGQSAYKLIRSRDEASTPR